MLINEQSTSARSTTLVTLRDAGPGDAEAVVAVHAASFPTDAEAKLVVELLAGHDVVFSLAAESPDRRPGIIGHALLTSMTHEDGGSVRGLVGLAPLSVLPEFRGRGIGKALVREAVRQCREHRIAALFVLGDPAFYGPLGFQPASKHGFTSDFDAGDAFQMLPIPGTRPVPPGRVSYAPAFNIVAD
ncbi:MAG: N-acetyltransferase [Planctomycetota bacterium]